MTKKSYMSSYQYIEVYSFFMYLVIFIVSPLFLQVLFKNVCSRSYNIFDENVCKNNKEVNDHVQKYIANLLSKQAVIHILFGIFIPLISSFLFIFYKSITLFSFQIFCHVVVGVLILCYNVFDTFDANIYAIAIAIMLSMCNLNSFYILIIDYISINTDTSKRTTRFVYLNASVGLAFVIGQISIGSTIQYLGYNITALIYLFILLMTSLSLLNLKDFPIQHETTVETSSRTNDVLVSFYQTFKIDIVKNKSSTIIYIIYKIMSSFYLIGVNSVLVVYLLSNNIRTDPMTLGFFLAGKILVSEFSMLFILPLTTRYIKISEWKIIILSEIVSIFYPIGFSLVGSMRQIFYLLPLLMLDSFLGTISGSTWSKLYDGKSRIVMFGIDATISYVFGYIGVLFSTKIYSMSIKERPTLIFMIQIGIKALSSIFGFIFVFINRNNFINETVEDSQIDILSADDETSLKSEQSLNTS